LPGCCCCWLQHIACCFASFLARVLQKHRHIHHIIVVSCAYYLQLAGYSTFKCQADKTLAQTSGLEVLHRLYQSVSMHRPRGVLHHAGFSKQKTAAFIPGELCACIC
jgi:hypothetical protein